MTYFTFQRIITFLFGIVVVVISYFIFQSDNPFIKYFITALIFGYGIYIIIAALLPSKKMTQNVSDGVLNELFYRVVFEIPFRIIITLFTH